MVDVVAIALGEKSLLSNSNNNDPDEIYKESLKQPTPASSVADTILEIANSSSWQLRYLVGPDAAPFLGWRASMRDEQWVDWHAQNDEDFCNAVKNTFGMTIKR